MFRWDTILAQLEYGVNYLNNAQIFSESMAMRFPHLASQSKRKAHRQPLSYLETSILPLEEEEELLDKQVNNVKPKQKGWFGLLED